LANCIVHADYTLPASVLVVRRPDMFGFRNPGLMRIPIEQALKGGESDGRNRIIQSMFLLVGLGEKAGSGLPKIRKGWQEQHWTPPNLYERETPSEQTLLELRMIDLISPEVISCLVAEFGDRFSDLGHDERIIVATAHVEGVVNHSRALSLVDQHPSDLTKTFRALIHEGFLRQIGSRRGTSYVLPNSDLPTPDEGEFGFQPNSAKPSDLERKPLDLEGKPSDLEDKPMDLEAEPSKVAIESSTVHGAPLVKSPRDLTPEVLASLHEISLPVRETGKCAAEVMERVICAMCEGRYITLGALSEFLNRSSDYLRPGPLKNLIKARKLSMAYPQMPNHPGQAYTSTRSPSLAES
jgi:ATP-dependent DNA helicase RecG